MNRSLRLKAGGDWIPVNSLKDGVPGGNYSPNELSALQMCHSWLACKPEFEFQTSGSSGVPKTITFTRAQLTQSAKLTAHAIGLETGFTALVCLDTQLIAGAMMIVRSLVTGMNMIIQAPSSNPLQGLHDEIDFAAFVPYQLITLLAQEPPDVGRLKTVIIGGAPLPQEYVGQLQKFPTAFYATYGMTETATHVALQRLNGPGRQDFFRLLPGVEATADGRGCLVLKAPHLSDRPIVTNDRVSLIDKESFRWIGREDYVINSGGVKVQPEIVEQTVGSLFKELNISKRFFVTGQRDQKLGEQVTLVLEGVRLNEQEESLLKQGLTAKLGKYEVPRVILYIPLFLETASQKIDRIATMKLQPAT